MICVLFSHINISRGCPEVEIATLQVSVVLTRVTRLSWSIYDGLLTNIPWTQKKEKKKGKKRNFVQLL